MSRRVHASAGSRTPHLAWESQPLIAAPAPRRRGIRPVWAGIAFLAGILIGLFC